MSTVRFATVCDAKDCGARSKEYSRHAVCRECLDDFCESHIVPGTLDEESGKALCLGCEAKAGMPECPNCGKHTTFTDHEEDCVETHGLDCGPYERWTERWMTCDLCGARTDDKEVEQCNRRAA